MSVSSLSRSSPLSVWNKYPCPFPGPLSLVPHLLSPLPPFWQRPPLFLLRMALARSFNTRVSCHFNNPPPQAVPNLGLGRDPRCAGSPLWRQIWSDVEPYLTKKEGKKVDTEAFLCQEHRTFVYLGLHPDVVSPARVCLPSTSEQGQGHTSICGKDDYFYSTQSLRYTFFFYFFWKNPKVTLESVSIFY